MSWSNNQVANLLREVATAITLKKGNQFKIKAYEGAAEAIEHSNSSIADLWKEHKLDEIPSVGEKLETHLEELFKTGKVRHFETLKKGIPKSVFEFILIPSIGPKMAMQLSNLKVKDIGDLKEKIKNGKLVEVGFSAKIAENIMEGIDQMGFIQSGRMLLPFAWKQAQSILDYLKKDKNVEDAQALGSLRRMVSTIGDFDFAVSTKNPKEVINYISSMPNISKVLERGESNISLALDSGLRLDFLISNPESFGSMLQHFTGSKQHNIHLRTLAERKGLSLSQDGIKLKNGKLLPFKTEEAFYKYLNMQTPPPEIREDTGEIELALKDQIPKLVELSDIKGDLHTHSSFVLEASHGPGADSIKDMADSADKLGYKYIGISDHPPSFTTHSKIQILSLIKSRVKIIEYINRSKNIRVLNLLELDILASGELSVEDEGLKTLDFALAGIHSAHNMKKDQMTKRILKALSSPFVKVLTHPTGRLLNERESIDADWEKIFKYAAENNKAMEIDGFPNRLDLSDNLIKMARSFGVKFIISSDAHEKSQMENMRFGVAMGRRGWLTPEDVINSWDFKRLAEWFKIKS